MDSSAEYPDAMLTWASLATMLILATTAGTAEKRALTFSPLCICGDEFVNKCYIFKSLPLSLTDDLWVAAFVGPKQVQIEHHLSTLSVTEAERAFNDDAATRVARSCFSGN